MDTMMRQLRVSLINFLCSSFTKNVRTPPTTRGRDRRQAIFGRGGWPPTFANSRERQKPSLTTKYYWNNEKQIYPWLNIVSTVHFTLPSTVGCRRKTIWLFLFEVASDPSPRWCFWLMRLCCNMLEDQLTLKHTWSLMLDCVFELSASGKIIEKTTE